MNFFQFRETLSEKTLDELSQDTLKNYYAKAGASYMKSKDDLKKAISVKSPTTKTGERGVKAHRTLKKRFKGLNTAANKMAEDTLDELSKKTVNSYQKKARSQANNIMKSDLDDMPRSVQTAATKALARRKKGLKTAYKKVGVPESVDQLDELSTNTLGRYAKKANQHADIGASSGADNKVSKRVAGAQLAVKKLGKRAGDKSNATRTANNIAKNAKMAKDWRSDHSVDRNKTYSAANKGIDRLLDKAAKRRGK